MSKSTESPDVSPCEDGLQIMTKFKRKADSGSSAEFLPASVLHSIWYIHSIVFLIINFDPIM